MSETLHLPLKKQWFDMIKSGEKKEEYRELSEYWESRIYNTPYPPMKVYGFVEFSLGYPKKGDSERRMTFELKDITIGEGKPEWGAEKGKRYFVLKLGRRVK